MNDKDEKEMKEEEEENERKEGQKKNEPPLKIPYQIHRWNVG